MRNPAKQLGNSQMMLNLSKIAPVFATEALNFIILVTVIRIVPGVFHGIWNGYANMTLRRLST